MSMAQNTAITAALLSTGLISLAPNLLLLLFPNYNYQKGSTILTIGQCLAAGGLLGDVFLHTLPHSLEDGNGNGEKIGLTVLLGFTAFLIMDIVVRSFGGGGGCHSHSSHCASQNKEKENATDGSTVPGGGKRFLSSSVLLNLTADSLHNFTDGLAIGASYAASATTLTKDSDVFTLLKSHGGLASLSILLHEIPHELGDFAVLVSNGFSRNEALMAQFGTALAAFCGTIVGLFAATAVEEGIGFDALLPFTCGGFVYLACVTILPEVLEETETTGHLSNGGGEKNGRKNMWVKKMMQLMAFGTGIAFMHMVSILEHAEGGCSHGHHHHHHGHTHDHGHHHHGHVYDNDHHEHDHNHEHHHHHQRDDL
mmetsp:Transcript_9755/g.12393  ORF Transcript_9755/g.12393 Transcript_9755/m.12393 type:complete len:368 (-) Transcript_9755:307-1410(-)